MAYTTCPGRGLTGMSDHAGTVACCILVSMPNKGHVIWLLAALVGASRGADIPEVYRVVLNMNVCVQCCGSSGVSACCCSVLSLSSKPNNGQIKNYK